MPLAIATVPSTVDFVKAALNVVKGDSLNTIEIGNEPDMYPNVRNPMDDRPGNYGPPQYAAEYSEYLDAIQRDAAPGKGRIFQAGALASNARPGWTV